MKTLTIAVIILMMLAAPASASLIDDFNAGIDKLIKNLPKLSLPSYSTVTIKCDSGASCKQEGENWIVTMNSMSDAQTIDLTLPSGTKAITGDMEITTQGTVTIEVKEKAPIRTVPVTQNNNFRYVLRDGWLGFMNEYTASVFERSGLGSTITTRYDVQLITQQGSSAVISQSYDYRQPATISLYDSSGNMATIRPSHQLYGGLQTEISGVVFVDDGYGTWVAFDKNNFAYYLEQVNSDIQFTSPWNLGPQSWAQFLQEMKNKGLQQFTDLAIHKDSYNVILTYPVGSVGTSLQAIIPKKLALSLEVRMRSGEPVVDSATIVPNPIVKGQGLGTLTVMVTNRGTSDVINVNAIVNGATVTAFVNSLTLAQGQQGTFSFSVNPIVSQVTAININVVAVAQGSGKRSDKIVTWQVNMPVEECPFYNPLCKDQKQKIIITAYAPDKNSVLSNAPIFKNSEQVGQGKYEADLPYGNYVFSTNNASNTKLFAPTPVEIELKGGDKKVVNLYFSDGPPQKESDMTWLFWLAIIGVFGAGVWMKNPILIAFAAVIVVLYVFLALMQEANTLIDKLNPFNWW